MTEPKKPNAIERKRVTLQETDRQARLIIHADQESTRNKTKRLKAQRLSKDAREDVADLDQKKPGSA